MRRGFAALILGVFLSVAAQGQDQAEELTPQKRADILSLMQMTGSVDLGAQLADAFLQSLFSSLRAAHPEISEIALTATRREISKLFREKAEEPGGLMDRMIPVYNRYWTHAEVKELTAFYRSELGQKAIHTMPKMLGESTALGQEWGKELMPELLRRIQEIFKQEGIEFPQ